MICSFMSLENPTPGPERTSPVSERADQQPVQREADIYDFLAWFEVNKGKLLKLAIAIVVIGFAIAFVRHQKQQKELQASSELLKLKPTMMISTNQAPPSLAELNKITEGHHGTAASERAELLAASTLFTDGKFAEAQSAFSKFAESHQNSVWGSIAAYGIAASLDAMGKTNEAVTAYQSVSTSYPESAENQHAQLALARIYEGRSQPEQALKIYNQLSPPGTMVTGRDEAYTRREALLRQHPHLNTNRPPSTALQPMPAGTNRSLTIQPATNGASLAPLPAPATNK